MHAIVFNADNLILTKHFSRLRIELLNDRLPLNDSFPLLGGRLGWGRPA